MRYLFFLYGNASVISTYLAHPFRDLQQDGAAGKEAEN